MVLKTYFTLSSLTSTSISIFVVLFFIIVLFLSSVIKTQNEKEFIIENLTTTTIKKEQNKKTLFFIGDSIINNKNYIANINKSVPELLKQGFKDVKVIILAQDNATIQSVYSQIDNINKDEYKNCECIFCISVGGNDMLEMIWSFSMNYQDVEFLFKRYILLIKKIKKTFPKSKIYLLTLYYPTETIYQKYYDYIHFWNLLLEKNRISYGYNVVNINKYIGEEDDFTYSIEPSEIGGEKITRALKENIKI